MTHSFFKGQLHLPAIGWILIGGLAFRAVIAYFLPAGFDEAYYFLYTQHLDWSYFDHPVAVALSTGMGIWSTSIVSPFTLRLGALVMFTGSLWLLNETGRWLFGDRAGTISALIASFCPLFILTFGTLTAPDNALIFFWSTALYLCAQEFFPKRSSRYKPSYRLATIGLLMGLCTLSKYHGFLLSVSLVCFCLSSTTHRRALSSKWMGIGTLLFGVCLFPVVYWNIQHDWISFQFQLVDRFATSPDSHQGLATFSLTNFLGGFLASVGFIFPTIGLPLWWTSLRASLSHLCHKPNEANEQASKIQFLLWAGLPVAAGFTLASGLTHTYPAWLAPGLWALALLLGQAAAKWPRKAVHHWLTGTGFIVGILLLFTLAHVTLGTLQKPSQYALFGGFLTPEQDPSTALIDTQQLKKILTHADDFQAAIATTDFVLTQEFWLSGYVAMALPQKHQRVVGCFSQDPRGHAIWFDSRQWLEKDALFVSIADFDQAKSLAAIAPYFESITPVTALTTQRGQAVTETFYLYRAHRLIKPYPYPY